jgi:formylglycine-generating enzyme required for sulfatase activity
MGSPPDEVDRADDEGPQHKVTIARPFAVGKYEVTFAEWDACEMVGGCKGYYSRPRDEGWGRGRRPVINVPWDGAKAYAAWLSRKTGKTYRLLSEAEWEYAARAGTTTPYAFGDKIISWPSGKFLAEFAAKITAEVGSFPANRFGLHDMHGNVWEWVEDPWHRNYEGAPTDGSVWSGGHGFRVVRGGSWHPYETGSSLRSANRHEHHNGNRGSNRVGFRVARTL